MWRIAFGSSFGAFGSVTAGVFHTARDLEVSTDSVPAPKSTTMAVCSNTRPPSPPSPEEAVPDRALREALTRTVKRPAGGRSVQVSTSSITSPLISVSKIWPATSVCGAGSEVCAPRSLSNSAGGVIRS